MKKNLFFIIFILIFSMKTTLKCGEFDNGEIFPKAKLENYPNAWSFLNFNIKKSSMNDECEQSNEKSSKFKNIIQVIFRNISYKNNFNETKLLPFILNLQNITFDHCYNLKSVFNNDKFNERFKVVALSNYSGRFLSQLEEDGLLQYEWAQAKNCCCNTIIFDGEGWEILDSPLFAFLSVEKSLTILVLSLKDKLTNKNIIIFNAQFDIDNIAESANEALKFIKGITNNYSIDFIFSGNFNFDFFPSEFFTAWDKQNEYIIGAYAPNSIKQAIEENQIFYNKSKHNEVLAIWKDPAAIDSENKLIELNEAGLYDIDESCKLGLTATDYSLYAMITN